MRAINHAMTGALIGLSIGKPVVALPAALASHFIMDVVPHHGSSKPDDEALRSKLFAPVLLTDAILCGLLVLLLAIKQPLHWQLAAICAFVAAAPDFLFVKRYIQARRGQPKPLKGFIKWTRDIQWFQRPIGAVVEIAWFTGSVILMIAFLK
jgi:hypothetical protein